MPQTRKPKYLNEVLEADFIRQIDEISFRLYAADADAVETKAAAVVMLGKNISELKSHVTKGYSLREWDKVFDILLNKIDIGNFSRRGHIGYDFQVVFDLVYNYCRNSIKSRLPIEQEITFLSKASENWRGSSTVYKYAKYVVKGKLPEEVESSLNCEYSPQFRNKKGPYVYTSPGVMKYVRWLKENNFTFESLLMRSTKLAREFYIVFGYLPDNAHNFMVASKIGGDQVAVKYFKDKEKFDHFLMGALSNVDQTQTIKEFLEKISK